MDKAQPFLTNCLLTKSFTDPNKPIKENRLTETLLLLPTDGGLSSRLKKTRKSRINLLEEKGSVSSKQPNYREINKNSKLVLKEYINSCRNAVNQCKRIAKEKQLADKKQLNQYLKLNNPELQAKLPQYEKFKLLHDKLWVGYVKELLNLPQVAVAEKLNINGNNALLKLSMADYNGCELTVAKSRNRNMQGISGIVMWDSQKNFTIVTKGKLVDEVKCIPKKGTVFNFEVPINETEALQYTILGDRFKYRSSDRAGRKFKSRRCDDMLFYIASDV